MADELDITYKEYGLHLLEEVRDSREKRKPLLPIVAEAINGVPLEDCDSKTKMRAGFQATVFLMSEMANLQPYLLSNTNDDGASSKD